VMRIRSSIFWVVNPSDAPYSVVGPFWATDGIYILACFWRAYLSREGAQPYSIRALNDEVTV
jgi:hypothetical protein